MKKATLSRVFSFVLLIGLMASCSKHTNKPANPGGDTDGGDPQTDSYYVKTKMDGQVADFSGTVKAMRSVDNDGTHTLQIRGIKGNGSTDEVDLVIYSAADATAGEYTEGEHDNYFIIAAYEPQNRPDDNGIYVAGKQQDNSAPFHINITEITDKHVKGTFGGAFFDGEGDGANEKKFTEGEFEAPIQ